MKRISKPETTPAQTTHYDECWRDPAHHACAVAEIERLLSSLVTERMAWEDAAINRYDWLAAEINRLRAKLAEKNK